jgi:transposase-like protein
MAIQKFTKAMFDKRFPDDDACLEFLKNARWPKGITCVKCQKVTKHYRIRAKKAYGCEFCGTLVSPTADTIFHKSRTSLRDWFYAMFLLANTRMGISAKHLERELGITYKTAWRMFTQIRKLIANDAGNLFGQVEVDETYIGGERPGKRGRGAAGKTIAVGIVERGGKAIVEIIPNVQARTLLPIITEHIPTAEGTTIYTDEMPSYNRLGNMGFNHETVNHAAKEYVNGTAHTNTVDGLWSIVKNGITGANRHVSPQHLQSYLDAYVFRYNHRDDEAPMFGLMMEQVSQRLS